MVTRSSNEQQKAKRGKMKKLTKMMIIQMNSFDENVFYKLVFLDQHLISPG